MSGRERIEQFKPLKGANIRLRATKSIAQPVIRDLAIHSVA